VIVANERRPSIPVINPANGNRLCIPRYPIRPMAWRATRSVRQGSGSSAAPRLQIHGPRVIQPKLTQDIRGAAHSGGEPFSTWAGAVFVDCGGGGEVQFGEALPSVVDPASQVNGFHGSGNPHGCRGPGGLFGLKEGFLHKRRPVLHALAFAKELDLNAAVRVPQFTAPAAWCLLTIGAT